MRKAFPLNQLFRSILALLFLLLQVQAGAQQPFPSQIREVNANSLSADWLVYDQAEKKLVPYISGEHTGNRAFYQTLLIRPDYPLEITFPADKGLSIFLNNQLLFTADSAADYLLDLTSLILLKPGKKNLLTVWSPGRMPDLAGFTNANSESNAAKASKANSFLAAKPRPASGQNAFILVLLVIGLIYGTLRTNFSSDFNSVSRLGNFLQNTGLEEGFLVKPIASWPGIFFVMAFALGFSVLVVAIRISGLNTFLFSRFFQFSDSDILVKIIFNAGIVFIIVLARYVFLNLVAYIFNLAEVVGLQYREFLRGVLFMGLFLPVIVIIYLIFKPGHAATVSQAAAVMLVMLLTIIVVRVIYLVNKKESLFNLHLFSYICATEIIPFTVVLKLILFNS